MNTTSASLPYPAAGSTRQATITAAFLAASLHLGLLYGFRPHIPSLPPRTTEPKATEVTFATPEAIPDDEPLDTPPEEKQAAANVPTLRELLGSPTLTDISVIADLNPPVTAPIIDGSSLTKIPGGPIGDPKFKSPQTFKPSEVDIPPRAVATPAPQFPEKLRRDVSKAEVRVNFVVNPDGTLSRIRIVSASHPGFEDCIERAMSHWKFKPGIKGSKPVYTRVEQTFVFTIDTD